MLTFDGPCEYDDLACMARRQEKPAPGRTYRGECPKHSAQPPDFDTQPRAVRFVHEFRSECARKQDIPRNVSGPRFAQRACEFEQHRTACERHRLALSAHDVTARIHDERFGGLQRFDFLQ